MSAIFSKIIPVNSEFVMMEIDVDDPSGIERGGIVVIPLEPDCHTAAQLRSPLGGLLKLRCPVFTFRVSDAIALGWHLRVCISSMFSGDAAAAGLGTTL